MDRFASFRQAPGWGWIRHYRSLLLLLTLAAGAAIGLAAAGPVLVEGVETFALRRVLADAPAPAQTMRLTLRAAPDPAAHAGLDGQIRTLVDDALAVPDMPPPRVVAEGTLPATYPWVAGDLRTEQRIDIRFLGDADPAWPERVTLTAGQWPPAGTPAPDTLPVVVGEPLAAAFGLAVGDRLPLSSRTTAAAPTHWLRIAAIAHPLAPDDPLWQDAASPWRVRDDGPRRRYVALLDRDTFFATAADHYPGQSISLAWIILPPVDSFTPALAAAVDDRAANLAALAVRLDPRLQLHAGLVETVEGFLQRTEDLATPLLFLSLTTALLALLLVGLVALLTVNALQPDWDVRRARGAGTGRLLRAHLLRSLLLTGVALLPGMALAGGVVWLLGRVGPLAAIRDPAWGLRWPAAAWNVGLAAAAAVLLLLVWPAVPALRGFPLRRVRARFTAPTRRRLQLLFLIVLLGGLLTLRYALPAVGATSGPDWSAVAAPLLLLGGLLAGALLLVPRLVHRALVPLSRQRGLVPLLALQPIARGQGGALRIMFLFAVTVMLGVFAASIDDALARNEVRRARFATGGDVQLQFGGAPPPVEAAARSGVTGAATLWRGTGSFEALVNGSAPIFDVLALDGAEIDGVVDLQPAFAAPPLPEILPALSPLTTSRPPLPNLPPRATHVGIWLRLPTDDPAAYDGFNLQFKFVDETGAQYLLPLVDTGRWSGVWRFYDAPLPDRQGTLYLQSIWLRSRFFRPEFRENVGLDSLLYRDAAGVETVVTGFESAFAGWFPAAGDLRLFTLSSELDPLEGGRLLEIGFGQNFALGRWYGMVPAGQYPTVEARLPGLVSREFADLLGVDRGDRVGIRVRLSAAETLPFALRVEGVVDYFPTLDGAASPAGFVLVDRETLLSFVNAARREPVGPNELLLTMAGTAPPPEPLRAAAARVITREQVAATLRTFPLAVGLRSAALLSYGLATLISLAGFAAHLRFLLLQRRRQLGVLQVLGGTPRQLFGALLLEQGVLLVSGVLLGSLAGSGLTWLLLTSLDFDWGGLYTTLPFLPAWDWSALLRTYALLGVTVLLAVFIATLLTRRLDPARLLRFGGEG